MILRELLKDKKHCEITYRTNSPYEENMLVGYASYENGNLMSVDGDGYSLDDVISKWEWNKYGDLTVWYDSKWI